MNKVEIITDSITHYRYFEFTNEEHKIIIRPDADVENGWSLKGGNPYYDEDSRLDTPFILLNLKIILFYIL